MSNVDLLDNILTSSVINSIVTTDIGENPPDVDVNIVHCIEALTAFGLIESVTDLNSSLMLRLKSSYVKLNSIDEIISACKAINLAINIEDTSTIREWRQIVSNLHPLVQKKIDDLQYFRPVSEEVGARVLGYYKDLQSLQVEEWSGDAAKPIRKSLENKLNSNTLSLVNGTYQNLNKKLVSSLSNEFFGRETGAIMRIGSAVCGPGGEPYTPLRSISDPLYATQIYILAPDFHIVGDSQYKPVVIDTAELGYLAGVAAVLQGAIRLINYLYPVSINGVVVDDTFVMHPEEDTVIVNRKKDAFGKDIILVNNSVLIPKKAE